MLPGELAIEPDELAIALKHLQNLDPTGVGARSPAECLELQLLTLPESTPALRARAPASCASSFRSSPRATSRS